MRLTTRGRVALLVLVLALLVLAIEPGYHECLARGHSQARCAG